MSDTLLLDARGRALSKTVRDVVIDHAYVMSDGSVVAAGSLPSRTHDIRKSTESNQSDRHDETEGISQNDIVTPPFDPDALARFLDMDEVHARCVSVKATDAVVRDWNVEMDDRYPEKAKARQTEEREEILEFIDGCNVKDGFEGTLEKAAIDFEAVGWAALEVVRSVDKKIRRLYHIPAQRVRVLRGWRGFVELSKGGKPPTYYQPLGDKVLSPMREDAVGNALPYDARFDTMPIEQAMWNLKDKADLNKNVPFSGIAESANELFFLPKHHPGTIYYGVPDFVPAVGSILANINIRDFVLQFFEHNTVPQYAVVIKGARLDIGVRDMIMQYFNSDVKGSAHKTLVIPLPSIAGGDVSIEFHKLENGINEGAFQDIRKNNQNAIVVAHRVYPGVVGIVETASLGSGKGSAQADSYKNRVVTPSQKRWTRALSRLFRHGLNVAYSSVEFERLDVSDQEQQRKNLIAYLERGALTLNDVRNRAKLGPPLPNGDRPFVINEGRVVFLDDLESGTMHEQGRDAADVVKALHSLAQPAADDNRKVQAKAPTLF